MQNLTDTISLKIFNEEDEIENVEDFKLKQIEYEEEFLIWNISKSYKDELGLEKEKFVLSEKGYYYWINYNLNKILIINFI